MKIEHIGTDEVIAAAHLTNRTVLEFQDNGDGTVKLEIRAHFAGLGVDGHHLVLHKPPHGIHGVQPPASRELPPTLFLHVH